MAQLSSRNDPDSQQREIARLRFQLRDANARAEIALSRLQEAQPERVSSKRIPKSRAALLRKVLKAALSRLSRLAGALSASGSSGRQKLASGNLALQEGEGQSLFKHFRFLPNTRGPAMLFIVHGRGGGTDRHLQEMRSALESAGIQTFVLRSNPRRQGILKFDPQGFGEVLDLPEFVVPHDVDALAHAIRVLGIKHIHVQHLADAGDGAEEMVRAVAGRAGIKYDVTIHDYIFVCPRITLIGASGIYCGEPEISACNACLKISPVKAGTVSIEHWRERAQEFLSNARLIFVPSSDVAARMHAYFPQIAFTVRPHLTNIKQLPHAPVAHHEKRRIATMGVLSPQKGAGLLLECAKYAAAHNLPIEFIVIGYTSRAKELSALPNLVITGAYQEEDLYKLIREHRPDIAWFPSLLPETFSYTLSAALEAGIFPVTFDLGTPAQRLRELGWGAIMPLEHMLSAPDVVHYLLSTPVTYPPQDLAASANVSYESILSDYYGSDLEATFQSRATE